MKNQELPPELILLEQISKKLSVLIALSFKNDTQNLSNSERIIILGRFGLNNQDIADILGTTKGTVEVQKSRANKSRK